MASSPLSTARHQKISGESQNKYTQRPATATVRGAFAQALSYGGAPISSGIGSAAATARGSAKGCVVYKCGWCPAHSQQKVDDLPTWERLGK